MTVTAFWFGQAFTSVLNKEIDWEADDIVVQLHTSSFTPNQDTMRYQSDLTNEVANGNGYTTGGSYIPNTSASYVDGTNTMILDGDNIVWPSSTITARYAVLIDTTPGSSATNPLISYVNFGADVSSTNGNFTITWSGSGINTITPA